MKLFTHVLTFTAATVIFSGLALAQDDQTGNADMNCTTQVANDAVSAYQAGEEYGGPIVGAAAAVGTVLLDPCQTAPPELDEAPQSDGN